MLGLISRFIGFMVVITLSAIGANTVAHQVASWKRSYDNEGKHLTTV
jgi:hypothetical protein